MGCNCNEKTAEQPFNAEKAFQNLAFKQAQLARVIQSMAVATAPASVRARAAVTPVLEAAPADTLDHTVRVLARIVGGHETDDFPECCLVGRQNPNGTINWFCTGVLVHPRIVLTAGHCFNATSPANVVALSASNMAQLGTAEVIKARKMVQHPLYAQTQRIHDISVMILRSAADTTPVNLAVTAEIGADQEVELVGFGNSDRASTRGFGIKRRVSVEMVSVRRNAGENLDDDEQRFDYESDVEFVAGGEGFDSCNGDSGGPAYLLNGGARKVAGLTSRAIAHAPQPCGDGGVYTRADMNLDFIRQVASSANITV